MEGVAMCDYCHNIQEWKKFNAPKDYLACIEYIQQLVTNGGFELLEEESTCPLNQVETEDGWADEIMVHMVRCKHCGQVFTCVVNVVVKHFCNTLFENSPGISSFKWCFPIIVGMRTDMIVPYVHISV